MTGDEKGTSYERVLETLTRGLDPGVAIIVRRRTEAMLRELNYLRASADAPTMRVLRTWPPDELAVIFVLSSFYQVVLGPLLSSAPVGDEMEGSPVLGADIPIAHGKSIFDRARSSRVLQMGDRFSRLLDEFTIDQWWLQAYHARELMWRIDHGLKSDA